MCTLMLRMDEYLSSNQKRTFQVSSSTLGLALLISNASVLAIGVILILRACFNTSEADFLDAGYVEGEDFDAGVLPSSTSSRFGSRGNTSSILTQVPPSSKQEDVPLTNLEMRSLAMELQQENKENNHEISGK